MPTLPRAHYVYDCRPATLRGREVLKTLAFGAARIRRFGAGMPFCRRHSKRDPRHPKGLWVARFLLYDGGGARPDNLQARRKRTSLSLAVERSHWWRLSTGQRRAP